MPSPLRGVTLGFLDDLYVDPAARGAGVGEALIARDRRRTRLALRLLDHRRRQLPGADALRPGGGEDGVGYMYEMTVGVEQQSR